MRRDSVFGGAVHLASADLYLEQLAVRPEHRRVPRLVPVRLRLRDVVLDSLLERRELIVNDAEGVVAIGDGVHGDTRRQEVVDLFVRLVPLLHFLVDWPQGVWASAGF